MSIAKNAPSAFFDFSNRIVLCSLCPYDDSAEFFAAGAE